MQISSNSGGGSNTTHSNLSRMDSATALKGMIREEGGDRSVQIYVNVVFIAVETPNPHMTSLILVLTSFTIKNVIQI